MSAVTKEDWLAALRSGKYKQGHGVLRDKDNGFCCLGVYCDLTSEPGDWLTEEEATEDESPQPGALWSRQAQSFTSLGDHETLSEFMSMLGVPYDEYGDVWNDLHSRLQQMNDGVSNPDTAIKKHTLREIADWIEGDAFRSYIGAS